MQQQMLMRVAARHQQLMMNQPELGGMPLHRGSLPPMSPYLPGPGMPSPYGPGMHMASMGLPPGLSPSVSMGLNMNMNLLQGGGGGYGGGAGPHLSPNQLQLMQIEAAMMAQQYGGGMGMGGFSE